MYIEEKSQKETFEELINNLTKEKSIKTIESIYEFLKNNRKSLYNNNIIPTELSMRLIRFLRNKVISVEIILNIFKIYIDEFFTTKNFPETELDKLKEIILLIFNIEGAELYSDIDFKIFLRNYFDKYYPKDKTIKHKVGDVMDIMASDQAFSKKIIGWTQMTIIEIDEKNKRYTLGFPDSIRQQTVTAHFDDYQVQEKNTFVTEEEVNLKKNLKIGDVIDFYNYEINFWTEGYITDINIYGDYKIQPIGEEDNLTKFNTYFENYSTLIQPLLKFSFKYDQEDKACFSNMKSVGNHQPYRFLLPVTKNNYTIPDQNLKRYSLEYYELVNYFIIKVLESNVLKEESLSILFIYTIFHIILYNKNIYNIRYLSKYFSENCYDNIQNILIKFSTLKEKHPKISLGWKTVIIETIHGFDLLSANNLYIFSLYNIITNFIITFGYNCFKYGYNLETKHLGLSEITFITPFITKYFNLIGINKKNKMIEFLLNTLLNTNNKEDIFTLLYSNNNIHEELLSLGNKIIIFLSELKIFTNKHIEILYNLAINTPENSDINKSIYELLNNIIQNFTLNQKEFIFNQIISSPYDKIKKYDIDLIKNLLKNITSKESFLSLAKNYLEFYYKYITEYKNYDVNYNKDFGIIISYAKDLDNLMILYPEYFKKFLDEIIKQNNLEKYRYYFTLLHSIYNSLYDVEKSNININIIKDELKKIFYEKFCNYDIIVDKLLELYNLDKNEKTYDYLNDVVEIVSGFINIIGDYKFFTVNSLLKLSDFYIFDDNKKNNNNKSKDNRNYFLYTIININKDDIDMNQLYDKLFEKIDNYLNKITLDNSDENFISTIFNIYEHINNIIPDLKNKTDIEIFEIEKNKYLEKKDPFNNKYFDCLWKMFYKYKNSYNIKDNINKFFQDFSLKNFSAEERFKIWDKLVQKIFNDFEKNNLISLTMIQLLLKISEKYGNAHIKSHINDLYYHENKKVLDLSFDTNTKYFLNIKEAYKKDKSDYGIDVSSTILDIKYMIEDLFGYDPIIQKIIKDQNIEINDDSLPLYKIFPFLISTQENSIQVCFERNNNIFYDIPTYPLLSENSELTDKFIEVIVTIFYKYAENDIMTPVNFATFIKAIYEPLNKTKYEMENIYLEKFKSFSNNKGHLTCDDFLLYFANEAQNNIDLTYSFLESLGYTKSLDYYLDTFEKDNILYYQKNNNKEFLPRFFIGNNLNYMKTLFNYLKNDDENILIENKDKNKLNELLYDDNLELKVYIYDIIITLFNDELNFDKNFVYNFIQDNIDKIINEFDKINKKDNINKIFNSKQYIRYYSSITKLLLLFFKNIVGVNELNNYIEKFTIFDNKDVDINKLKLNLNEEKQILIKKINLPNLLYTILNNLLLFYNGNDSKSVKTKNSAKLIVYIMLLISNYYEEKEKMNIYKNFCEKQMILLFSNELYDNDISFNIFYSTKILYYLLKEEKNEIFIILQNEELCKNIKDYKKLNTIKADIMNIFDLFNDLLDVHKKIQNDEIFILLEDIINNILDKNILIEKKVIEGYLQTINKILDKLKKNKYEKIYKYNFDSLVLKFINEYLITYKKDKYNLINKFISFSDFYNITTSIYEILMIIFELNPEKNIKFFFENENIQNLRINHLTKLEEDKSKYCPLDEIRNIYVGLYNPSALCYINSVIQLFFMLPLFQNTILSLPLNPNLNPDIDNDDFMFQLQKMFYYLKYSAKKYYNPKSFVLSFKDSQGKPPDLNEQCDAQEFLLRFIEKINESLKNTNNKYLCDNIFGGNTLQRIKCTNPECGNVSERRDNINYLSLEIQNKNKLEDCLKGFIVEEKVEDYHCEKCDKKITHIKQVLIDQIPNILIIHLQRFVFNYTYFTMEKLNTPMTFTETLNLKNYTIDKDNNDIPLDYFDYELKGALIHSGQQQYGHYYSLIYNKKEKMFYEFNDMNIKEIDFNKGMELASGNIGGINNAYMLIYEKKIKKPVIINNKKVEENIEKILEDKNIKDKIIKNNDKIYHLYDTDKDAIKYNININNNIDDDKIKNIIIKNDKLEAELIKYDDALNNIINKNNKSYESNPFIDKILSENIKLKNDNNFYINEFTKFIYLISKLVKEEIINDITNEKIISYIPILKSLNEIIINIIALSGEKESLPEIVNNLIKSYEYSPNKELISYLIKYIEQIRENIYNNYLITKDRLKGDQIGKYIAKIISIGINSNIEIDLANNIIQYFIDKIPIQITKKWLDMASFNEFIYQIINNSDIIKKNLINKNIISKLIDFILGKSSPLYKGDERNEFIKTKGHFEPIIKSIALLYKYYEKNISNDDLILSPDDKLLINYDKFYDKIKEDNYGTESTDLLMDNKLSLIFALSIKENKNCNDKELLDLLINKNVEKINTKEEMISYLEYLITIIKNYSLLYLNKDNDTFIEKLNILLGIAIPTVNSGNVEIKYVSGKFYDKYTILTNIVKEFNNNNASLDILYLLFNLISINDLVFNYLDNLFAPFSLNYSYVDYLLKIFLSLNSEEYENLLANNEIIKKSKKINLEKNDLNDKLYFSDFSYELKKNETNENVHLYELNIKYTSLKESKKTNLECFNNKKFFSTLNKENKKEPEKEEIERNNIEDGIFDNLICVLVFCPEDLDINIEFKPYCNSKLEIKGYENNHYIFFCTNKEKIIDYSKIKINTKKSSITRFKQGNKTQTIKFTNGCQITLQNSSEPRTWNMQTPCGVCGVFNEITKIEPDLKCSFCEAPLLTIEYS